MDMLKRMYPSGAEKAMKAFGTAGPETPKLGLGAFFGSKQITTGIPMANTASYQPYSFMPPQQQTNYSSYTNLLGPK